jgi:hypothetical protein
MPTPPNFSSWRHFHGVLIRTHNPIVKKYFDDLEAKDRQSNRGQKAPSIGQIRTACTIQVNDSAIIASGKIALFSNYMAIRNNQVDVDFYAIPIEDYHEKIQFKPQIVLLFRQRDRDVPSGRRPLEGQIGFRWMRENISEFNAESMANKIDFTFGSKDSPEGYERGAVICNYVRPEEGYRLRVYAYDENEGRRIIEKTLSLQDHQYDPDFFSFSQTRRNLRSGNESKFIYGESRDLPRERPSGEVYFYRAELKIWGVRPDVTLVDYSGRRSDLLD